MNWTEYKWALSAKDDHKRTKELYLHKMITTGLLRPYKGLTLRLIRGMARTTSKTCIIVKEKTSIRRTNYLIKKLFSYFISMSNFTAWVESKVDCWPISRHFWYWLHFQFETNTFQGRKLAKDVKEMCVWEMVLDWDERLCQAPQPHFEHSCGNMGISADSIHTVIT